MFDKELVLSILAQIEAGLEKIASRAERVQTVDDFTDSLTGQEKLSVFFSS